MSVPNTNTPADVVRDVLTRLSRWDVLNLPPGGHDDGPYWQREIAEALAALDALDAAEARATTLTEALESVVAHASHFSTPAICLQHAIEDSRRALAAGGAPQQPPQTQESVQQKTLDAVVVKRCDDKCWQEGHCTGACNTAEPPVPLPAVSPREEKT